MVIYIDKEVLVTKFSNTIGQAANAMLLYRKLIANKAYNVQIERVPWA